jgi:hypothetical protein
LILMCGHQLFPWQLGKTKRYYRSVPLNLDFFSADHHKLRIYMIEMPYKFWNLHVYVFKVYASMANFLHFVWMWNLVSRPKGRTQIEDVWEHGTQGDIWD